MKRCVKATEQILPNIHIVMYLYPIIYANSEFVQDAAVVSTVTVDKGGKYHTDINPSRIINGPLSNYGVELESPIKDEWKGFIDDCEWLVKEVGFTIIKTVPSNDSKKSTYLITYGIDDTPCGTIVYDLRLSDHPFAATFPDEYKELALEYLKMNHILDGTATKAGIDFQVEKVTVGVVKNDTWDRALNRLYQRLKSMKNKIKLRLKRDDQ